MDAIEKRVRELHAAAKAFYNATVGDPSVTIRCQSSLARNAVTAFGERVRLALLDKDLARIVAHGTEVVAAATGGAHEVHSDVIDGRLDLPKPGERLLAADALEHGAGVLAGGDGQATADHSAQYLEMVERLEKAARDAERYRYIRSVAAGEPRDFGRIEDAAFAAHYGDPAQFDFNVDEQMAALIPLGHSAFNDTGAGKMAALTPHEEPDQALLVSMAMCLSHGFGLDTPEQQQSQLREMRKLWDEVMGRGYYSPDNRERYVAMLAARPEVP
ncbi:TPA: hypothetical protein ACOEPG_002800 [Stenotrophomonas maltophilia]